MTDIVDRLRSMNADFLHEEAAAEIERLRAEIVLLETTGAEASDEIERLRAEVHILSTSCGHCGDLERAWQETERLRAALRQIASGNTCMALTTHPPICARAHTARAALGENEHD